MKYTPGSQPGKRPYDWKTEALQDSAANSSSNVLYVDFSSNESGPTGDESRPPQHLDGTLGRIAVTPVNPEKRTTNFRDRIATPNIRRFILGYYIAGAALFGAAIYFDEPDITKAVSQEEISDMLAGPAEFECETGVVEQHGNLSMATQSLLGEIEHGNVSSDLKRLLELDGTAITNAIVDKKEKVYSPPGEIAVACASRDETKPTIFISVVE